MSDLAAHLLAAAFPGAAQPSNLLSAGSGGRGGGAGGGDGGGGVGVIGGSSGGGGGFGQQRQQPFDGGGLEQQQQGTGGTSSYGGGGGGGRGGGGGGGEKLDLSDYRRLAKPKQEPADESEIIVSSSGNIRPYVENATELLTLGPRLLPAEGGGAAAGEQQQGGAAAGEERKAPLDRIFIKGTGQAMANAILVAEGARRSVPNLHMIVRAQADEVLDDWVLTPAAEEERRIAESQQREDLLPLTVKVPRTVYQLVLILAKHVTNEELQDVGYQAPLAPGYSSSADFLQDAEKRGFGGRRGGRGGGRRGRGRGGYEWGRSWRGGYRGGRGRGRRGRGGDFPADQVGGTKREDIADY